MMETVGGLMMAFGLYAIAALAIIKENRDARRR